ncbi:hypothetical protein SCACP_35890 [Sporomusa carbonis]|uniref:CAP domain-containing protein n=1 Tax=Sporomusa carbonis TaxID=3076075 RepID=UPI003A77CBF5
MINNPIKNTLVVGILSFSLLTTSFGGAFATSASAASPDNLSTEESVQNNASTNSILAGIAAIGVIAALSNHGGSSDKSSSSSKNSSGTSGSTQTGSGTVSASGEQQAVSLLNKDRAANGLPALKVNSQLTRLAENYAQDMIKRGYFSHYNPEGQSPFDRMNQAGISYKTAGENLAINTSVAAAETAFMNSSGHRANILNASYTEVGIGVVQSPNGSVYVVQEFIGK